MSLYFRIAAQNVRKNYRFFIPRILTEAGLLACLYIVYTLVRDERMSSVKGGAYLPTFMVIGVAVISLLSVILMLYTNSFLMKQRKREFGLYNVLGMEKRHVGKVLFWEGAIGSVLGVFLGLLLGVLFYKLSALLICRLLAVDSVLGFYYVRAETLIPPALFFLAIDLFTTLVNWIGLARMKPVELLSSAQTGEREPRVRWLMLLVGAASLGAGYWLSVSTENPLRAIVLFFVAVFLVILGTYFLFVTGTTFVLKRLKANRSYYYQKRHMTAVSGLLYRMKQNAVGLASICILATGVLVMISTTVSLYAGTEQTLDRNYPRHELYLSADYDTADGQLLPIPFEAMREIITDAGARCGVPVSQIEQQRYLTVGYAFENGVCVTDRNEGSWTNAADFIYLSAGAYETLTGEAVTLAPDELAFCVIAANAPKEHYELETLTIGGQVYRIKAYLPSFPIETAMISTNRYGVVVADDAVLEAIYLDQREAYGETYCSSFTDRVCVSFQDRSRVRALGTEVDKAISMGLYTWVEAQPDHTADVTWHSAWDAYWESAEAVYGMYGTFLFLGILLGLVCLFATALIIYYKQISEGYEDRGRYQIMEKIGMSQTEVRASIRSQVLLVFFLPLAAAAVHVCFAFPMLLRLLRLLLLSSTGLFVACTAVTFAVFALVYVAIYSVTARTYYKIVH